ncbi:MAG: hypothetical protein R2941_22550 [Desulfobacterales bacterium]
MGKDWLSAANLVFWTRLLALVDQCLEDSEIKRDEYIRQLGFENNDRADVQEKSLKAHRDSQLQNWKTCLKKQKENKKVAPMTKGRIDALNSRVQQKLIEIENGRNLNHHKMKSVSV